MLLRILLLGQLQENMANLLTLPPEIRLMVWLMVEDVVDGQRMVVVDHSAYPTKQNIYERTQFIRERLPTLF